MTDSPSKQTSTGARRGGGTSAATRITTAGIAVAMTLGLGGAVAARAAEQKRADLQDVIPGEAGTADVTERARYDAKVAKLQAKYQKHLDELAAEYSAKLGGTASDSGAAVSDGYSSSASGSSSSNGGNSARGNSSIGSSSGNSGAAKVTAPKAPATSKGS